MIYDFPNNEISISKQEQIGQNAKKLHELCLMRPNKSMSGLELLIWIQQIFYGEKGMI